MAEPKPPPPKMDPPDAGALLGGELNGELPNNDPPEAPPLAFAFANGELPNAGCCFGVEKMEWPVPWNMLDD